MRRAEEMRRNETKRDERSKTRDNKYGRNGTAAQTRYVWGRLEKGEEMQRDLGCGGDMNGDEMRNAEKRLDVTRRERRPAETGGHKRVNDERIESEQKRRTVAGVVNVHWRSGE